MPEEIECSECWQDPGVCQVCGTGACHHCEGTGKRMIPTREELEQEWQEKLAKMTLEERVRAEKERESMRVFARAWTAAAYKEIMTPSPFQTMIEAEDSGDSINFGVEMKLEEGSEE